MLWHILFSQTQRENLQLRAEKVALESELEAANGELQARPVRKKRKTSVAERGKAEVLLKKRKTELSMEPRDEEDRPELERQHKGKQSQLILWDEC